MRIRVTREFGGRLTSEQRIYPGEYEMDAPALFGVGKYLLDNGFAEQIPLDRQDPEFHAFIAEVPAHMRPDNDYAGIMPDDDSDVSGEVIDNPPTDYSDWTVKELDAEIEARGMDADSIVGTGANGNVLKDDKIAALVADDEAEG